MNDIKSIRWECWIDGSRNVSWLHIDREEGCQGLQRISFIFSEEELHNLAQGKLQSVSDLSHHLSVFGDSCTFYNMEFPRSDSGQMTIPYFRLSLHRVFWRYLERIARFIWAQSRLAEKEREKDRYYSQQRVEIEIPLETLVRFQETYGTGKGNLIFNFSDKFVEAYCYSDGLKEKLEMLKDIARNYTQSKWGTAMLIVSNDGNGYYWSCWDNFGRRGLNGGLINHGQDEQESWSIHT